MRSLLVTFFSLAIFAANSGAAQAKIAISIDKDNQTMTVEVDGVTRYNWPISSGNPSHETPSGSFRAFRLEEDHYSKEFDEAPMPHSIFFTKRGHAIHGTDSVNRLGSPASHGCVRLSRANAATLFALVEADGVLNTTVTLTGSSQVALARNPRSTRTARRNPAQDPAAPLFDAAGNPIEVDVPDIATDRRVTRQVRRPVDDGYIYPADGVVTDQRYPAPRGYRRSYDASGNAYYYDRQGYAGQYAPQVYAPRPAYQPRGLFNSFD